MTTVLSQVFLVVSFPPPNIRLDHSSPSRNHGLDFTVHQPCVDQDIFQKTEKKIFKTNSRIRTAGTGHASSLEMLQLYYKIFRSEQKYRTQNRGHLVPLLCSNVATTINSFKIILTSQKTVGNFTSSLELFQQVQEFSFQQKKK